MHDDTCGRRRIIATFAIFAAATAIILARIAFLASSHDDLRRQLQHNAQATRRLTIPGMRGNILSPDGKIIAYSERRINVVWHVPLNYNVAESAWHDLTERKWIVLPPFEQLQFMPGTDFLVAQDLPFDDKQIWDDIFACPLLEPVVFFKRIHDLTSPWHDMLGTTQTDPVSGLETGISGLEKKYDHKLRAKTMQCSLLKGQRLYFHDSTSADGASVILQQPFQSTLSATP